MSPMRSVYRNLDKQSEATPHMLAESLSPGTGLEHGNQSSDLFQTREAS